MRASAASMVSALEIAGFVFFLNGTFPAGRMRKWDGELDRGTLAACAEVRKMHNPELHSIDRYLQHVPTALQPADEPSVRVRLYLPAQELTGSSMDVVW